MKTAIIIGGTSGIGCQVAVSLLEQGWRVGIAGRRDARLKELADQYGLDKAITQHMDITRDEATAELDALLRKTGAPDLFLHVAGIGRKEADLDEESELRIVNTHCDGMVRVIVHFINYVKRCDYYTARNKATIGIVSSMAGTRGMGTSPAYSSSKKMQSTYAAALAQYARMYKIPFTVSDIRPGFVATEMLGSEAHYPAMMSATDASRYILYGLKHRRRIIIFDWRYKIVSFVWNLIPRGIWERMTFVKN